MIVPNILICPNGHSIQIDGENLTLNDKEYGSVEFPGNPCKGYGFPCPSCSRLFWEPPGGGAREMTAMEFVVSARIFGLQIAKGQVAVGYVTGMLVLLDNTAATVIQNAIEENLRGH